MDYIELAKGLGLFSLALGTVELVAGRQIADRLGIGSPWLVRICGTREAAAGLSVLAAPDRDTGHRRAAAWATLAVAGATLLDTATALTQRHGRARTAAVNTRLRSVRPKVA